MVLALFCSNGSAEPPKKGATPPLQATKPPAAQADAPAKLDPSSPLLDPTKAIAQAKAKYSVKLETTKGDVIIDVTRDWAPLGADRFYNLVKIGYYDNVAFFRVIPGFMAQVGIHGDPRVNSRWREARIPDDAVTQSNTRGMVTFAMGGPNTRTTQFFINFADNSRLNPMGFPPFGRVRDMAVMDKIYGGYGEGAPGGRGPSQGRVQMEGNSYLKTEFPELDYIKKATIISE
ncbi:MAG: peptidylprolyl isomerase [Deltaproteobacteria bacterium]|nr:peptidylprolyl isomerase [Deltaproteobacteria bacterium]